MTVQIRYLTDPACIWSWGAEPQLRRLAWEFGDAVSFRWVLGGLARSYAAGYRDSETGIGVEDDPAPELLAHWLEVSGRTGMPCDPLIWRRSPLATTYPACIAVKAAAEQGPEAEARYLRALREGIVVRARKLDHLEALVALAGEAGLDAQRFRIDAESNAALEAFGADLEEVRTIPEGTPDEAVVETEGRRRLRFPTAVFVGENGERRAVHGWAPYERLREAALAAGAEPQRAERPSPLEVVERLGRVATREVEEITGLPAPVVRAELWGLAREWRLRPLPAPIGELWELA
jgi:protein-disulfide isomerase-like protein with CxxC motif